MELRICAGKGVTTSGLTLKRFRSSSTLERLGGQRGGVKGRVEVTEVRGLRRIYLQTTRLNLYEKGLEHGHLGHLPARVTQFRSRPTSQYNLLP